MSGAIIRIILPGTAAKQMKSCPLSYVGILIFVVTFVDLIIHIAFRILEF